MNLKTNQTVIQSDNLTYLRTLDDCTFDLIYLDPPYATGLDYYKDSKFCFSDKYSLQDLYVLLDCMAKECYRLLKPTGTLYFHSTYKTLNTVSNVAFRYFKHVNTIIWAYNSAPHRQKDLGNRHDPILRLVKSDDYKYHIIREPYAVHSRGEYYNPGGKVIGDVWEMPILAQNDQQERTGYPTQKPLALLERIICISTDTYDTILDPYMGSGTTLIAAKAYGRNCVGIDSSKVACDTAKERLATCL